MITTMTALDYFAVALGLGAGIACIWAVLAADLATNRKARLRQRIAKTLPPGSRWRALYL